MTEYSNLFDLYRSNKDAYLKLKVDHLRDQIVYLISQNIIVRHIQTVKNPNPTQRSIIITVPHMYCISGISDRTCDRAANMFADILDREIRQNTQDSPSVSIIKIVSEQSRYVIDDNRLEGLLFKTPLWRTLIRELSKTDPSNIILFDVHSFPSVSAQDSQKDRRTSFGDDDIAILANMSNGRYNKHTVDLQKYLGLHTIYEAKTGYNAILDVSTVIGASSFLLEINESLSAERVLEYAKRITVYIKASPLLK